VAAQLTPAGIGAERDVVEGQVGDRPARAAPDADGRQQRTLAQRGNLRLELFDSPFEIFGTHRQVRDGSVPMAERSS
jgi:hypothetical protein